MCFVYEVIDNNEKVEPHSWELVKERILRLPKRNRDTLLLVGSDGQMTIAFAENEGYYISTFGSGELEEWLAVDESRPNDQIKVSLAGEETDLPKNILVSEKVAMDVAKLFYFEGKRSRSHKWMKSIDLM
ncbi:MAG: hypothetical protein KatS3mg105_2140 [Gemmatales bacterium]|nr:MAG: hypothetical protein KatS3mg105_2140 [Gemmatales bacterium]